MTRRPLSARHHEPRQTDYYEGRPAEDQFDRSEREARELLESSDRILEAGRAEAARKREYRDLAPRLKALRQMGLRALSPTHGQQPGDVRGRRATLAADPVFQSRPERAQVGWEQLLEYSAEQTQEGNNAAVWRAIDELAQSQLTAKVMADWAPPEG